MNFPTGQIPQRTAQVDDSITRQGNMSGTTEASSTAGRPPATPLGLTEAISARGLLFAASLAVRASTDRRKSGNRASVATGKPTVMLPVVLIFVAARWGNFPSCPTIATAGNCRECKNQMQVCSHFALTLNVGVSKNQFAVKVIMVCEARGQKLHNPLVAVTYVFPE